MYSEIESTSVCWSLSFDLRLMFMSLQMGFSLASAIALHTARASSSGFFFFLIFFLAFFIDDGAKVLKLFHCFKLLSTDGDLGFDWILTVMSFIFSEPVSFPCFFKISSKWFTSSASS